MTDYQQYLSQTGRHLHESAIRRMGTVVARGADLVSFAPGYPDPTSFPWDDLREIADRLLHGADPSVLQYGPTRGHAPLIDAVVGILASRDIHVAAPEVMITSGSQQGVDLVARVFLDPGDAVLVELPTFTGAIAAFRNVQAEVAGVRQDADGIDLGALDDAWQRQRAAGRPVKLLYLIPNFQNPTGRLLALEKRLRVLEWAERRNVIVLEDDPYGSLYFEDAATVAQTRPMRADDRSGRVIYLSSFSKTLAPGFRVAWMVAPPSLIDRFDTAKQSVDLTSGILDQRIVHEAIRRGVIDALAPRLRALYGEKRRVMEEAMRATLGDRIAWESPKGGFFVWARITGGPTDEELLERALHAGVVFVTGSAFHVDGSGHDTIRLSFSAPSPERIREGMRRLAAAVHTGTETGCDFVSPVKSHPVSS